MENGPEMKMYFLLKMVIFQPAMFVYQRVVVYTIFLMVVSEIVGVSTLKMGGRFESILMLPNHQVGPLDSRGGLTRI